MPIDVDRVRGARLPDTAATWGPDDVILYHLGLGAGAGPGDLRYVYEDGLVVLPTFAAVPAFESLMAVLDLDGVDLDATRVLHGEQIVTVHRPLPTAGSVRTLATVVDVYDKGSGAAIVIEAESSDDDGPLFTNTAVAFARGEGGFGGSTGPPPGDAPPERPPDETVESTTLPQQAALYRLSGDRNPLHIDPAVAARGGFDAPILHGLCTYGIVARAVVDHALDGDVTAVSSYRARFAGVVLPGETVVTSLWREPGRILIRASCRERGTPVLANAAITLKE